MLSATRTIVGGCRSYCRLRTLRNTEEKVKTVFPPEVLRDLIHVADSFLVTYDNLEDAGADIKSMSPMPAAYGPVLPVDWAERGCRYPG